MGLPGLLKQAAETVLGGFVFLARLAVKDEKSWETYRLYTRRITAEEREAKHSASRKAKKFRPRRLVLGDGTHRLAEEGERGGMLYGTWSTKLSDMDEFGLGIGTFFVLVAGYSGIFFLQSAALLPSIGECCHRTPLSCPRIAQSKIATCRFLNISFSLQPTLPWTSTVMDSRASSSTFKAPPLARASARLLRWTW